LTLVELELIQLKVGGCGIWYFIGIYFSHWVVPSWGA